LTVRTNATFLPASYLRYMIKVSQTFFERPAL